MTDHGPALPRAKSTLYDAGTGIAFIVRPPRTRRTEGVPVGSVYDGLFSGVDLVPTILELLGVAVPDEVDGLSHADNLLDPCREVRSEVYAAKTYHDSFDPIRAVRTTEYCYIENYAVRPLLDLPWDIEESAPGQAVAPFLNESRPPRELYDLIADPTERHNLLAGVISAEVEAVASRMALLLNDWRQRTNDVIPSDFAGSRISERYTQTYAHINGITYPSRAADAAERGIKADFRQ
jgi:arylsulfatase A-like enzyme